MENPPTFSVGICTTNRWTGTTSGFTDPVHPELQAAVEHFARWKHVLGIEYRVRCSIDGTVTAHGQGLSEQDHAQLVAWARQGAECLAKAVAWMETYPSEALVAVALAEHDGIGAIPERAPQVRVLAVPDMVLALLPLTPVPTLALRDDRGHVAFPGPRPEAPFSVWAHDRIRERVLRSYAEILAANARGDS